jgi:DNA-binding transcriptional LysR family regulator
MTIQTDDITVFLAVAREGSFGRAASALLVSQPAISDRMARLEHEVGGRLFHRTTRGATLTPAGDAFLPYAERTIDLLHDAAETLRAVEDAPRLRLAVHATFAHRVVPLVLRSLETLHRSVKVRDAHSDAIIAALLDGACDAGFIVPAARPRQLRFVPLPPDPVVAVVAPSHPLAGGSASMHDLVGHRVGFNRFGPGADEFVERLRKAGVPEWSWTECSDTVTALHLAIQDEHVAMVTKSLADVHTGHGAVRRLVLRSQPRWTVPLTFAYRSGDQADPAIAAIRSAVEHLPRRRAA